MRVTVAETRLHKRPFISPFPSIYIFIHLFCVIIMSVHADKKMVRHYESAAACLHFFIISSHSLLCLDCRCMAISARDLIQLPLKSLPKEMHKHS